MSSVYILQDCIWLGQISWDEQGNLQASGTGWRIKLIDLVDGNKKMVFTYQNQEGDEIQMYEFNPPSSLSTSQFKA